MESSHTKVHYSLLHIFSLISWNLYIRDVPVLNIVTVQSDGTLLICFCHVGWQLLGVFYFLVMSELDFFTSLERIVVCLGVFFGLLYLARRLAEEPLLSRRLDGKVPEKGKFFRVTRYSKVQSIKCEKNINSRILRHFAPLLRWSQH